MLCLMVCRGRLQLLAIASIPRLDMVHKPTIHHDLRVRLSDLNGVKDWEVMYQPYKGSPFPVLISVTHILNSENQIKALYCSVRQ